MTQIPIDGVLTPKSNFASVVDIKILTVDHMWKTLYDPEGILSTLPAIATTIFGMFLGMILLRKNNTEQEKLKYFVIIGIVALILGYAWDVVFAMNKTLWTSSFVLVTGGLGNFSLCFNLLCG